MPDILSHVLADNQPEAEIVVSSPQSRRQRRKVKVNRAAAVAQGALAPQATPALPATLVSVPDASGPAVSTKQASTHQLVDDPPSLDASGPAFDTQQALRHQPIDDKTDTTVQTSVKPDVVGAADQHASDPPAAKANVQPGNHASARLYMLAAMSVGIWCQQF